jgi:hypothetical protein
MGGGGSGGCQATEVMCGQACAVLDDHDTCTTDSCNPATGAIDHVAVAGCVPCTVAGDCDDKNECTTESCPAGVCEHTNVAAGTGCDDEDACTMGEACDSGVCQGGAAVNPDDKDACTTDSCVPASGVAHISVADGLSCTLAGATEAACKGGVCQKLCGDGVKNGTEACDGADLAGAACPSGFVGAVTCSATCTIDTSACACPAGQTKCNGSCVDTRADKNNCGACGHTCGGDLCGQSLCQPVVMATGQPSPAQVAVDGTTLYWTNYGTVSSPSNSNVRSMAKDVPLSPTSTLDTNGFGAAAIVVSPQDTSIFWAWTYQKDANHTTGGIRTLDLVSKVVSQVYPATGTTFFGAPLATDGTSLFFTTFNDGPARLHKTDLQGLNELSLDIADHGQVAVDSDYVYWTIVYKTYANKGGLYRASKQGLTSPIAINTVDNTFALAAGGGALCFTTLSKDLPDSTVYVADTSGKATVLDSSGKNVSNVLIADGYCYWTSLDSLLRRKLDLSSPTEVLVSEPQKQPLGGIAADASYIYFTAGGDINGQIQRVHK